MQEVKDAILEAQVIAALQGHDVGPFEPVDTRIGGWQAACRQCGLRLSLLGNCNFPPFSRDTKMRLSPIALNMSIEKAE